MAKSWEEPATVANYGNVIIKEELIIPDSDEELDVENVEKIIESKIHRDNSTGDVKIKTVKTENKYKESKVCEYCNMTLHHSTRMKDHLKRCESADPKLRRPSYVVIQPDVETAVKKLGKTYCAKCRITRPVKTGVRRCFKCKEKLKFRCTGCLKYYLDSSELRIHFRSIHLEKITYHSCDKCHCSYKHRKHLIAHIKTQHTLEMKFTCSKCGINFIKSYDLRKHRRICKAKPKYLCDKCNFKTCDRDALIRHLRTLRRSRKSCMPY